MKKISIIIPAHNEEKRIRNTLEAYSRFFDMVKQDEDLKYEIVVVLNGCTDDTLHVVEDVRERRSAISYIDLPEAGKGLAVKAGFEDALKRRNDFIGFVDADMATAPEYFFELIEKIGEHDGIIASRYMKGSKVHPPRPKIKRWGSWIVYESLVKLLFGISYQDYQCGAKLFKRDVIKKVTPHLTVKQWAFDVELLYLCKKFGFTVIEVPTVWVDKEGSKLSPIGGGFKMLTALFKLRLQHLRK